MKSAKKVDLKRSTEESREVQHNEENNYNTKDKSLSQNRRCPIGSYWSEAIGECIEILDEELLP